MLVLMVGFFRGQCLFWRVKKFDQEKLNETLNKNTEASTRELPGTRFKVDFTTVSCSLKETVR